MGKIKVQIISVGILLLGMIYIALSQHISLGQRYQKVFFNGDFVCNISQNIDAKQVEKEVRRSLAAENTDKLAMDYEMKTEEAREPFEMLSHRMSCKSFLPNRWKTQWYSKDRRLIQ